MYKDYFIYFAFISISIALFLFVGGQDFTIPRKTVSIEIQHSNCILDEKFESN